MSAMRYDEDLVLNQAMTDLEDEDPLVRLHGKGMLTGLACFAHAPAVQAEAFLALFEHFNEVVIGEHTRAYLTVFFDGAGLSDGVDGHSREAVST